MLTLTCSMACTLNDPVSELSSKEICKVDLIEHYEVIMRDSTGKQTWDEFPLGGTGRKKKLAGEVLLSVFLASRRSSLSTS